MRKELQEHKALNKLEEAAEKTAAPEQIEQRARRDRSDKTVVASKLWFIPYLIAVAACGAGILFLEWKPSLFSTALDIKFRRYLFGALAITLVFTAMKAVEVYIIARISSPVSRFNLARIL